MHEPQTDKRRLASSHCVAELHLQITFVGEGWKILPMYVCMYVHILPASNRALDPSRVSAPGLVPVHHILQRVVIPGLCGTYEDEGSPGRFDRCVFPALPGGGGTASLWNTTHARLTFIATTPIFFGAVYFILGVARVTVARVRWLFASLLLLC